MPAQTTDSSNSVVVSVLDIDPLVVRDCQHSVRSALDRHQLAQALANAQSTRIDVAFPDGVTADLTATIERRSEAPVQVLASADSSWRPPAYDLRSSGGRLRTYACSLGAERLAVEIAKRLGVGGGS